MSPPPAPVGRPQPASRHAAVQSQSTGDGSGRPSPAKAGASRSCQPLPGPRDAAAAARRASLPPGEPHAAGRPSGPSTPRQRATSSPSRRSCRARLSFARRREGRPGSTAAGLREAARMPPRRPTRRGPRHQARPRSADRVRVRNSGTRPEAHPAAPRRSIAAQDRAAPATTSPARDHHLRFPAARRAPPDAHKARAATALRGRTDVQAKEQVRELALCVRHGHSGRPPIGRTSRPVRSPAPAPARHIRPH